MNDFEQKGKPARDADALMDEVAPGNAGTGEISQAGRNPDKPGIGSLAGYAPDSPADATGSRTSTVFTRREPGEEVLDETDQDYLEEYMSGLGAGTGVDIGPGAAGEMSPAREEYPDSGDIPRIE